MNEINRHDEPWQACPTGTVSRMAGELRSRRKARTQRRVAVASGVGVALVAVAVGLGLSIFLRGPTEYRFGGIACSEVRALLPEYLQGALADRQLAQSIDQHLAECPHCGPLVDQMQASSMAQQFADSPGANHHDRTDRAHEPLGHGVRTILSLASSSAAVGQL